MKQVWCVRHRDGWCMASRQVHPPKDGDGSVRTKCGFFVVLPWGVRKRLPDCKDCLAKLQPSDDAKKDA